MLSFADWWFSGLLILCIAMILPLFALSSERRTFRLAALLLSGFALVMLAALAFQIVASQTCVTFTLTEIAPQVTLAFLLDRLAAFFVLTIALVALAVVIYSLSYIEHEHGAVKKNLFTVLLNAFILSMILVVAAANTLTFLFFWELMSVFSFFLVMFHYEEAATKKAGIFYFIMTQLSTVFLVTAFATIYAATGSFEIAAFQHVTMPLLTVVYLLLFVGFGIKAGIIPFHKWLPYAHPASPSNISALMSGVMLKVAVYGVLRFTFVAAERPLWWGILLLSAGTLSAILGGLYALKELDLKRVLAYHSIENIGILFIGIGLAVIFEQSHLPALAQLSLAATWFHTLNHALFKSLLFLTAGSIAHATGTRNLEKMGGLIKTMPYTAMIFLVGAVSISALPPFNGFVSELMIFQAFFGARAIANPFMIVFLLSCLAIFALTSALAAACFVRAFGIAFLALPRSPEAAQAKEVDRWMLVGPALNAGLCMGLGVFAAQIFAWFGKPLPIPNMLLVSVIFALMLVAVMLLARRYANQTSRVTETWGCGFLVQTSQMEYTASGFAEPIITIFKTIFAPINAVQKTYWDKSQTIFKAGAARIRTSRFHEKYLYLPVATVFMKMSDFLTRIQSSVEPDAYILVVFLTSLMLIIIGGIVIL